jgi:lysophospholipase L1-like esterase
MLRISPTTPEGLGAGATGAEIFRSLTPAAARAATDSAKADLSEAAQQTTLGLLQDKTNFIFGREYLAYFHKRLIAGTASKITFSGDSTTAGDGTTTPYRIWELIPNAATRAGLVGVTGSNRGQSGKHTGEWVSTFLAGDLADNPNLLVLRWGANDPFYGRNAATFTASLREGLTTIRATRDVADLSIVLCAPGPMSDTPNGRDAAWFESILPAIKTAARDFQCCFVDIYSWVKDASLAAGDWMDDPYGDGRAIHPLNVMNTWISDLLRNAILPVGLVEQLVNTLPTAVTPTGSFSAPGNAENMTVTRQGRWVLAQGYFSGPATTQAAGAAIGTVPVGFRPTTYPAQGVTAVVWNGSIWESPNVAIATSGAITLRAATTIAVNRIYVTGLWTVE